MPTATKTDTAPVRRLLADLHAAGWRHNIDWQEAGRELETGAPEHAGWKVHRWTRHDGAVIDLWQRVDDGRFDTGLTFYPFGDDHDLVNVNDSHVQIGGDILTQLTVWSLRRMAEAFAVVPLPIAANVQDVVYDALAEAWPHPTLASECNLSGQLRELAAVAVDALASGGVTDPVDARDACDALDAIISDYPDIPIACAAGLTGDFHAWTTGALQINAGKEAQR